MAHRNGVCKGHYAYFEMMRRLAIGCGEIGTVTYGGGNTGNGTLSRVDLNAAGSDETWTMTCSDNTIPGSEIWNVVGSTTGIISSECTTGIEFDYVFVAFLINAGGTGFAVGDTIVISSAGFSGSGNGILGSVDTKAASVSETFTIAHSGGGTWTVNGSVTGALPSATVGVLYENDVLDFLLTEGGSTFSSGDTFTLEVRQSQLTADGQQWEQFLHDGVSDNRHLILKGQGMSGTSEIWLEFTTNQDVAGDYFNVSNRHYASYVDDIQNTGESTTYWMPLFQFDFEFGLSINGQRITALANVENNLMSMYSGFYNSYHTPTSLPYPICSYGMRNAVSTTRYSDNTYFALDASTNMDVRSVAGINETPKLPHNDGETVYNFPEDMYSYNLLDSLGSLVPMIPIVLIVDGAMGELDGIFFTRGISQVFMNVVNDGTFNYIVGRDYTRTTVNSYFTIRLD